LFSKEQRAVGAENKENNGLWIIKFFNLKLKALKCGQLIWKNNTQVRKGLSFQKEYQPNLA
jgi:hypothetical protein